MNVCQSCQINFIKKSTSNRNVYNSIIKIYETFSCCTKLEKVFVGDDSDGVSAVRSFYGFVDFNNRFLGLWTHLEAFKHVRNLFGGLRKTYFFRVHSSSAVKLVCLR